MYKALFTSENKNPEIFIKLGEKCPTKCSGCFYGTVGSSEYDSSKILASLNEGLKYTQAHFKFFLYGSDGIMNPSIFIYLDFIYKNAREAVIQIDDSQLFDKAYIKQLLVISKEYSGIVFLLSKNVVSQKDISQYLKVMKFLSILEVANVRYDMTLDYEKFSDILVDYDDFSISKNDVFFNYEFTYKNIHGSITDLVVKNPAQGKLSGCKFTSCIFPDFYKTRSNSIQVKDMIEIDIDGNFRIHHPICFLSNIKISHIGRDRGVIIQDFETAKKYFSHTYAGDMEISCFNCIKKGYNYKLL